MYSCQKSDGSRKAFSCCRIQDLNTRSGFLGGWCNKEVKQTGTVGRNIVLERCNKKLRISRF